MHVDIPQVKLRSWAQFRLKTSPNAYFAINFCSTLSLKSYTEDTLHVCPPAMCSGAFSKKEKPASGPEPLWLLHSSCFRPVCLCFRFLGSSLCHRACLETHQKNQVLQKKKETQVGLNIQRGRKSWERGQAECWILNESNQPQELFITYIYLTLGEERQNQPWHTPPTAIDFDSVCVMCIVHKKEQISRGITVTSQELKRKHLKTQLPKSAQQINLAWFSLN